MVRKVLKGLGAIPIKVIGAAAMLTAHADKAMAQSSGTGIGSVANNISTNFDSIGKLLLNGCLLVGLGLSGAGLMKLKQASDDGGQRVKYSEGLWRLAVGGGLATLPFVTSVMKATVDNGGTSTLNGAGTVTFR